MRIKRFVALSVAAIAVMLPLLSASAAYADEDSGGIYEYRTIYPGINEYICPDGYALSRVNPTSVDLSAVGQLAVRQMPDTPEFRPDQPQYVEPGRNGDPEDYKEYWASLKSNSPLVLVVAPALSFGEVYAYTNEEESAHHTGSWSFEEIFRHGGFTAILVTVRKVCRNDTGIKISEGDQLIVKEEYYQYDGTLYAKYGSKQNPLFEGETLVFADVAPEDAKTPLYSFNNDFRIKLSGKAAPETDGKGSLYADAELIAKKYGNEILSYFGLEKNPEYPAAGWVLPVLVGAGVLVCIVPAVVVLAVRKRKKRSAPAGQPGNDSGAAAE